MLLHPFSEQRLLNEEQGGKTGVSHGLWALGSPREQGDVKSEVHPGLL
jgi:hypothetical protein